MENPSCELLCLRPALRVVLKIIFTSSLILTLFIYVINNDTRRKSVTGFLFREGALINTMTSSGEGSKASELPVCMGNLLDQREYRYAKEKRGSLDTNRLLSKTGSCRLLNYTAEQLVSCFDALHNENPSSANQTNSSRNSPDSKLHFVFMGDSRTRQQFYNFIRVIPDFDSERRPIQIPSSFHGDIDITSNLLRLRLSFQWRPLINETVVKTIGEWATNDTQRPYFIFLSMAVHHMMKENGANFKLYQENLLKLAPILGQLANATRVIWLNQYPSVDSNSWVNGLNFVIYSEKIQNYNRAIRQILENENSNIRIWDSSNPLAEEYVRGCATLKRDEKFKIDGRPYLFKDAAYADCNDYIHTGYSALSQATQLLFNDIFAASSSICIV